MVEELDSTQKNALERYYSDIVSLHAKIKRKVKKKRTRFNRRISKKSSVSAFGKRISTKILVAHNYYSADEFLRDSAEKVGKIIYKTLLRFECLKVFFIFNILI